ncbi:YetF domain-containing protein [Pontibacillus marinus]|uniref:DUF421 domain-containing protein n=1 Tax=Pontibacillus marinus BH030004 = DSM 16465 TaxID=1385511 RepID=A0A0A5FXS9_9BACI|nr:DUF421 domain-containing protein [Pontibacillus marinus]KGX85626.1 hypothetical protein N783_14120 [Pontibacillus marinus BH030004 = DSM 16465]
MGILEITLRIAIAFITLLLLTRLMGRKEISQLTFFNFVSAIAVGTVAGSLTIDQALSIGNGIYALVGWTAFTIIMGYIDIKSKAARNVIEGQPVIVVKQGQVMENELRKLRLDINELNAKLREKNVFSINEVDYAILETDGKLSVMKKDKDKPVTQKDMNLSPKMNPVDMPTEIISDGKLNKDNLTKLDLDENWVNQQLTQANIQSVSDVFYAEIQNDGSLYIDSRNDTLH